MSDIEDLFQLSSNENIAEIEAKCEKILLEPYHHVNQNKGKGFCNILIQVYNHWLKIDQDEADLLADLIDWAHSATLLLDDIQDSSELRRGNPAAHVIYGVGRTIAATDLSTTDVFLRRLTFRDMPTKLRLMTLNSALKLLEGQIMETYWRDNFICPTEDEYFDMVSKKTGNLLMAISSYMEFYSNIKINFNKLSALIGIYFQMADDYRGLKSKLYYEAKGFCDDIKEGKFIFPIIHAINSRPNDKRIPEILKMRTSDVNLMKKCLEVLEEFGSFEYTKNKLIFLKKIIIQEFDKYEYNDSFNKLFKIQDFDK